VIKDVASARKVTVLDSAVYPSVALLDPRLTIDLPASLTAATGIDALTHAVEGVVSLLHQPICDAIGLECVRLIHLWLPRALRDRADLTARGWMLLSATMAGQLVSMTFNGIAHAMAHALGVGWGVHHGTGNAIALPWSIRFNARSKEAAAMYARCSDAWGLPRGRDDAATAAAFADAVEAFVAELGLPTRLRALQLSSQDFARLSELAFADPAHRPNPVPVASASDIEQALPSIA
jgi:alcohol dehydrogenase class IV